MKYRVVNTARKDILEITSHIRSLQKSPQNAKLVAQRLKRNLNCCAKSRTSGTKARSLIYCLPCGSCVQRTNLKVPPKINLEYEQNKGATQD